MGAAYTGFPIANALHEAAHLHQPRLEHPVFLVVFHPFGSSVGCHDVLRAKRLRMNAPAAKLGSYRVGATHRLTASHRPSICQGTLFTTVVFVCAKRSNATLSE